MNRPEFQEQGELLLGASRKSPPPCVHMCLVAGEGVCLMKGVRRRGRGRGEGGRR